VDFFEERLFGKEAELNTQDTKEDLEIHIDVIELELEGARYELEQFQWEINKLNKEIIKVRTASANALLRLAETATNKFPHQLELDFVRECKNDSLAFLASLTGDDEVNMNNKTFAEELRELHLSMIKDHHEREEFEQSLKELGLKLETK